MTQIKIGDLVDTIYTSSSYPTISTPTRIEVTSKTPVDNIFYKDFTKKKYDYCYIWSSDSVFNK